MLAALVAAILRLSSAATSASAQELLAVRASLAARAGLEWGLYQAAKGGWVKCSGDAKELDLSAATGMRVAVSCDSLTYREGESSPGVPQEVRVYTLEAVACNSGRTCPDPERVAEPGYVERARRIHTLQ
ncbi:MAG: MSHA biogenesis protein MshP [Aquabacterium sp.]